jgi:hypothetical protein
MSNVLCQKNLLHISKLLFWQEHAIYGSLAAAVIFYTGRLSPRNFMYSKSPIHKIINYLKISISHVIAGLNGDQLQRVVSLTAS